MRTTLSALFTLISLFSVERSTQVLARRLDVTEAQEDIDLNHEANGPVSFRGFPRMMQDEGTTPTAPDQITPDEATEPTTPAGERRLSTAPSASASKIALSRCASASLDGCQDEIDSNMLQLCKVPHSDPSIKQRAVGGSERQLLASFFLKVIRAFSAKPSLTETALKGDNDDQIEKFYTPGNILGHGVMAEISLVLALIVLLGVIFLLIPICCCNCGKGCFKNRTRHSKWTVIIVFSILLGMFLLFYFGAVYYTAWIRKDVNSTACSIHKVAREVLFSPNITSTNSKSNGGNLFGIRPIYMKALDVSQALTTDFGKEPDVKFPTHYQFVLRNMAAAFAPLLFTNAMLQKATFRGWAPGPGVRKDTEVESEFNLNLGLFEGKVDGEAIIALTAALTKYAQEIRHLPGLDENDSSNHIKDVTDAQKRTDDLRNAIHDSSKRLVSPYNKFLSIYHYKTDYPKAESGTFVGIVLVTVLSVLWVLGAIALFVYYLVTKQYREPMHHQGSFMTFFAGFLTFSSFLWAFWLLLLASAIFLLAVPLADGCQFANKVLHKNATIDNFPKFFVGNKIFKTCVQGDNDGRLSKIYNVSQTTFENVKAVNINYAKLKKIKGAIRVADLQKFKETIKEEKILPAFVAVPDDQDKKYYSVEEGDLSCTANQAKDLCALLEKTGATNPTIYGLEALAKELGVLLGNKPVCIGDTACSNGGLQVNRATVRNRPEEIIDIFNGPLATAVEGLSDDDKTKAAHLARMAVKLSLAKEGLERSTMSGGLPELENIGFLDVTYSDPCPPGAKCPIFFLFKNPDQISEGFRLVNYDTWKGSWRSELVKATDKVTTDADMTAFIQDLGINDTTLSGFSTSAQEIIDNDHCSVLAERAEDIRQKVCDDVAGDFVGIGFLWFLMALVMVAGGVMCLLYWTARRRFREPGSRARDSPAGSAVADPTGSAVTDPRPQHEFMVAAAAGDLTKVRECAELYPPGSVKDEFGNEPLHLAAYYGHRDVVNVLLRAGHDPNALNFSHFTPLGAMMSNMGLETSRKAEIGHVLKLGGANLEVADYQGNSPLMARTKLRDAEGVRVLVDLGANPQATDEYNVTPAALARRLGDEELVRLLTPLSQQRGRSAVAEYSAASPTSTPSPTSPRTPGLSGGISP